MKRCVLAFELGDDYIESCEGSIGHDDRVHDKTGHEHLFSSKNASAFDIKQVV